VAGWKVTETDRQARELVAYRDEDVHPRDGLNVVLTIDSAVQHIVETALVDALAKHSPKSITGIVMRPRTGEILALASLPSYDPNNLSTISTNNRNRVIADVVEPGSTFKIVVVSGALNSKVVKLNDMFDCEHGHFAFAGRRSLPSHRTLGRRRSASNWAGRGCMITPGVMVLASTRGCRCRARRGGFFIRPICGARFRSRRFPWGMAWRSRGCRC